MTTRLVVTGVGVVSALGSSRDDFRDRLLDGVSGIAPISRFDVGECRSRTGASVTAFDATAWIPPMKLRRMDDTARYAVVATRLALEDAGYELRPDGDDDAGVVMGTFTAGGQATSEYLTALHRGGPTGAPALLFNSTVSNAPASLAGLEFKLRGPNVTVSQKEASGLGAVVTAADALRLNRARIIVAGGVDAIFEIFFRVHDRFGVLAAGDPADVRGPFDRDAGGFVLGEGGFALVLEARGASDDRACYGEILGVSAESAAVPINAWPTSADALARTMQRAIEDAGLAPDDVDVVYASANASALDAVEAEALMRLFSTSRPQVTSVKGALGECGACGAAALAAALVCGRRGEVPPIAGLREPAPAAASLNLVRERCAARGPVTLVNSFGSGGALFSVIARMTAAADRN